MPCAGAVLKVGDLVAARRVAEALGEPSEADAYRAA